MENLSPHTSSISEWLLSEGRKITSPAKLVGELARQLIAADIPVFRMRVLIRTLHPQTFATHYTWLRATGETTVFSPPHEALFKPAYLQSPIAAVFEGAGTIRRRLDVPGPTLDFPFLKDLVAEGATDYVAMPMPFQDGTINAFAIASDRPGGFSDRDLAQVTGMLPVLALLMELHSSRQTARTLLETYIGTHSGKRVLDGLIKRGDGEKIHAVIWFCDLRESSQLAEKLPLDDYLALLNDFFGCMAGAVLDNGGEVLRFIGDAALAIFPFDSSCISSNAKCNDENSACARAVMAARDARNRIKTLNEERTGRGEEPISFGIALHVGNVMYGNIGTPQRLEFTVIGKAANEAARLEGLCKKLGHQILISPQFPKCARIDKVSLGHHPLHEGGDIWEIFALSEEAQAKPAPAEDRRKHHKGG